MSSMHMLIPGFEWDGSEASMQGTADSARGREGWRKRTPGDFESLRSLGRRAWRARGAVVGGFILIVALCSAAIGPVLVPSDPIEVDLGNRLLPPSWEAEGSAAHPLGTDHLGRDVLARLLHGARISMAIGLVTMVVAGTLGVSLGVLSGYLGGVVDAAIMRAADVQQSFPFLALAIAIVAVLGPSTRNTMAILGMGGWVLFARIARAEALRVREQLYVEAAKSIGAGDRRIMLRHIMPNIASPCIVMASFAFSLMVIAEATLSFMGLGVPPPMPSWGTMLHDARNYLETSWWLPTFPGLAIMLTVLGVNMLGDWLRDYLDPRIRVL